MGIIFSSPQLNGAAELALEVPIYASAYYFAPTNTNSFGVTVTVGIPSGMRQPTSNQLRASTLAGSY